ncbi:hypothetical protein BCON_0130g00290 [Botryotinia convoluta]|uniref:Uncharacterized protein n=1 Tax=Botryotinia convoluta TaxID=54673 RepID=A0A4Z1HWF7_9HELO|nr:hypothetical protein BCON_0130g00290 [Botryotinia convoluta]
MTARLKISFLWIIDPNDLQFSDLETMLVFSPFFLAATAALFGFSAVTAAPAKRSDGYLEPRSNCHYLPTDIQWPGLADWQQLNQSINGKLILGKPLAQSCHNFDYNLAECTEMEDIWTAPLT